MINIPELDRAILHFNGVWPSTSRLDALAFADWKSCKYYPYYLVFQSLDRYFATKEQFLQRAKELGFVGKYRWGVEYATEGKEPEIDQDVVVQVQAKTFNYWSSGVKNSILWENTRAFKIVDPVYRPQDTRYLLAGVNMQEDKVPNKLENAAQELLDSLSDMSDEELSLLGNAPEVQTLIELLKSQEAEKNIQKQALALYRSVNYNCELQDSVIMFSKRFDDYVKAIKDGWRKE
jgi:hypothetical protein